MSDVETIYTKAYVVCPHCGALVSVELSVDVQQRDGHPLVDLTSDWDAPARAVALQVHCDQAE